MTTAQEIVKVKARLKRVTDKRGLAAHVPEKKRTNTARKLKPAMVADYFDASHNDLNGVLLGATRKFRGSKAPK